MNCLTCFMFEGLYNNIGLLTDNCIEKPEHMAYMLPVHRIFYFLS